MAKFYGKIGYNEGTVEVSPGIWKDKIVEHNAYGDVKRNSRTLLEGEKVNNDLSVGNYLSIVMDAYSREHFFAIRYVEWAGTLWIVSEVTVESPRLLLRLGGVYNGPTPDPVTP